MPKDTLNEREFELINIIGSNLGSNQRDLSRQLDLSLGLTNMLIRRLVAKGFIRISQLNKRKVQYLLTPKGFSEKMRKSVKYTLKTIHSMGLIKERIKEVVVKLYTEGERHFTVLGKSDFALLIEMVFKDMGMTDYKITYVEEFPPGNIKGTLLICKEDIQRDKINSIPMINLVQELARDQSFMWHKGDER
ncbi:MAG: hypothetical protein A2Y04_05125 [Omnitrophica WOR_2 bacterium GWC2_45_7]|nr:MAG: hypothetical protein A2Y04_05125 [Omnitrophica WOR_2 bacterium GWC2_45_7]